MSPLESWIVIVFLVGGIAWTTVQAYRLAKWKEETGL
jgi:hypothetical protein